jgi:hypothetical protein
MMPLFSAIIFFQFDLMVFPIKVFVEVFTFSLIGRSESIVNSVCLMLTRNNIIQIEVRDPRIFSTIIWSNYDSPTILQSNCFHVIFFSLWSFSVYCYFLLILLHQWIAKLFYRMFSLILWSQTSENRLRFLSYHIAIFIRLWPLSNFNNDFAFLNGCFVGTKVICAPLAIRALNSSDFLD